MALTTYARRPRCTRVARADDCGQNRRPVIARAGYSASPARATTTSHASTPTARGSSTRTQRYAPGDTTASVVPTSGTFSTRQQRAKKEQRIEYIGRIPLEMASCERPRTERSRHRNNRIGAGRIRRHRARATTCTQVPRRQQGAHPQPDQLLHDRGDHRIHGHGPLDRAAHYTGPRSDRVPR